MDAWVMSQDKKVAEICGSTVKPIIPKLMPLYLERGGNIDEWIKGRAIDAHRTHSRLLKRALRLKEYDDTNTVLSVYAATVTDNYWIKPKSKSELTYSDIKFKDSLFADLALTGNIASIEKLLYESKFSARHTPELTNIGSYEKCWKLEDGNWFMYKDGTPEGIFSELFIYRLGAQLGFDMAKYEMVNNTTIKSQDFTNGASVNFEPASSLVGENIDYIYNFEKMFELSAKLAYSYCDILFLDTICFNFDRHTLNYGFIRDIGSGDFIRLAPNFDNNLALIALEGAKPSAHADMLVREYLALVCAKKITLPQIDMCSLRVMAERIAADIPINVDKGLAVEIVCSRFKFIEAYLSQNNDLEIEL